MKTVITNKSIVFIICVFFLYSCNKASKKEKSKSLFINKHIISKINFNTVDIDTSNYDKYEIDFDFDGLSDIAYSSKYLMGDSLFIYKNTNIKYELSLKTINFSEDGNYIVDNIKVINKLIKISTYFNGAGGMTQDIYLQYNSNSKKWKIEKTVFTTTDYTEEKVLYEKTYNIKQNLFLNENTNWNNYKNIDKSKKEECRIKKIINKKN